MKRFPLKAILSVLLGSSLLISCDNAAPIPQKDLMNIYYDMLMVDGAVNSSAELSRAADSLCVYATIFDKYGYTVQDYTEALDFYLQRPEKFARMMKSVQVRINAEVKFLEAEQDRINTERAAYEDSVERAAMAALDTIDNPEVCEDSPSNYQDDTTQIKRPRRGIHREFDRPKPDNEIQL